MEKTLIRVGNDEYAGQNNSYGLTTLRDKHARINGRKVRFEFNGKSGVEHEIDLEDPKLTRIIRQCRDLPGQELFQYLDDDGRVRDVNSNDVNQYLRDISGGDFTTKDFRTWNGTVLAACALKEIEPFSSMTQAKRNVVHAIDQVAQRLGNTRAVCRKSYIHPNVIERYMKGMLLKGLRPRGRSHRAYVRGLRAEENAVLGLLRSPSPRRGGGRGEGINA
jgi:DNA topoisomerase-1